MHYPPLWKFRVLRGIGAGGRAPNRQFLQAWALCEGGTAANNPLNTTEPWPGATDYNDAGVKNYANGRDGINATCATLLNGHYHGIVADLRANKWTALQIASRNKDELTVWGTDPGCVVRSSR